MKTKMQKFMFFKYLEKRIYLIPAKVMYKPFEMRIFSYLIDSPVLIVYKILMLSIMAWTFCINSFNYDITTLPINQQRI